jgi:uncharacterized membrane protein YbaN (DUF454 family)
LREVLGDILKLAVFLKFGFYLKDYAERRASLELRRKDALHMIVLCCLFAAVLLPWYVSAVLIAANLLVYRWEMPDIRTDERAVAFETAHTAGARLK